jgi:glycosyltransferase involved in cell wall biosynthesis
MISVLTLTYLRKDLLEEAIQSFLNQDYNGEHEMVIVNDCPNVVYSFNHPKIKIYNISPRFSSVGLKLEWGMKHSSGDYVYRLDDDDLMTPWALSLQNEYILNNPGYDVYRCQKHYFYSNNKYQDLSDSINNGNCYSRDFINRIDWIDKSIGEDNHITFHQNAKIYTGDSGRYSMAYRWGMGVYHISGMGDIPNEEIYEITDRSNKESGIITLTPKLNKDYWSEIK